MKVTTKYGTYEVIVTATSYESNYSLAITLVCSEGPFATLTVNLDESAHCNEDCAFVDTNNCPWAEKFIRDNNLGAPTGKTAHSGFCMYPEYKFDLSKLQQEETK